MALRRGSRWVYNVVTKPRSSGTYPTLETMRQALEALRARLDSDRVTLLAIPRLGCGLDGLDWSDVRALLLDVFRASAGLTITVYTL